MSETGGTLDRALAWDGDPCGELARLTGAQSALVIGAAAAVAVAAAIGPDGVVVACDPGPNAADIGRDTFGVDAGRRARIDVWLGPVHETLAALSEAGESFDLVVIGADTPGSRVHLAAILDDGLLAADGLLYADRTMVRNPSMRPPSAAAALGFNAALAGDLRVEQLTLAGRDGQTLARWAR